MRKIDKGMEPAELTNWKRHNPHSRYVDLHEDPLGVRRAIRASCLSEQFNVCAYCGERIGEVYSHNEHVLPQSKFPNDTLNFANIVASCNRSGQCGNAHGDQTLPLTPLMLECEKELKFYLSGSVIGLTKRAQSTIDILRLGASREQNRSLMERRKQLMSGLLFKTVGTDQIIELEDDEVLGMAREELMTPAEGQLESYAPALVNVLNQILAGGGAQP